VSKSGSGFAALLGLGDRPAAQPPAPLDYIERYELLRLRSCELHPLPDTLTSEREEIEALRAALRRELEAVRAVTQDSPLPYTVEPVVELCWRRPLAEEKRKADENAREEDARKQREADEDRFAYLRQKRDHERGLAKLLAAAHITLTAAEREEQDALRK
jgi:hypothetical protein